MIIDNFDELIKLVRLRSSHSLYFVHKNPISTKWDYKKFAPGNEGGFSVYHHGYAIELHGPTSIRRECVKFSAGAVYYRDDYYELGKDAVYTTREFVEGGKAWLMFQ